MDMTQKMFSIFQFDAQNKVLESEHTPDYEI